MKKLAFTMLELVFVIVVIGILSAAIIPRMDRDNLYEASEQLLTHIRYTQHLAMSDNIYEESDANWFKDRWNITISDDDHNYSIIGAGTPALDPLSRAAMNGTDAYDLEKKYSIQIDVQGQVGGSFTLGFDHLGRPHSGVTGSVSDIMRAELNITLSGNGESALLTVTPETGYTQITY